MVSVLITVREGIDVAVVDERVVAISPGKLLGPETCDNTRWSVF